MYSQIKTTLCNNSNILLRSTPSASSRHSSCPKKFILCQSILNYKCLCQSLRTENHSDSELLVSSLNHSKINLGIRSRQHARKHMTNNQNGFMLSRLFHHTSGNYDKENRPVRKLHFMQSPILWLVSKLNVGILKWTWYPQFDESEFQRGTKQAVSTVTMFVSQNQFNSLKGLLTNNALIALQRDVETAWSDEQRRHVGLEPGNIELAIPQIVQFQRISEQKFCDVDMTFVGQKWTEYGGSSAVILVQVIARFHCKYTEGHLPDWTVSLFRVPYFKIIR